MLETLPGGYRHLALEDVASTNGVLLDHARSGVDSGLWISAKRQLEGRGSRGRAWVSEPGNLYSSLLIGIEERARNIQTLAFVASLAIRDAIIASTSDNQANVTLKWPNDVLLNGRKTSGILLESHRVNDRQFVILGMGINIAHYPAQTTHPATCLHDAGIEIAPVEFLANLAAAMRVRMDEWDMGHGFETTRLAWLAVAAGIGEKIEVQMPGTGGLQTLAGTFRGIDTDGLLELQTGNEKTQRISVADIFFA